MPRVLPKELSAQLAALNSEVRFSTQVRPKMKYDEKAGEEVQVLDRHEQPVNTTTHLAILINKADNKPWLMAEGGDDESSLLAALAKARTANRPVSTAQEVVAERDELKEKNAALEAELARIRKSSESIRLHPGTSQRRREPELPPALNPDANPLTPSSSEEPASDTRTELQKLLRDAGVKYGPNAGIDNLRQLAAKHGLIPAAVA